MAYNSLYQISLEEQLQIDKLHERKIDYSKATRSEKLLEDTRKALDKAQSDPEGDASPDEETPPEEDNTDNTEPADTPEEDTPTEEPEDDTDSEDTDKKDNEDDKDKEKDKDTEEEDDKKSEDNKETKEKDTEDKPDDKDAKPAKEGIFDRSKPVSIQIIELEADSEMQQENSRKITENIKAANSIENISNILETSLNKGGANKYAIEMMNVSLKRLSKHIGMKYESINIPATESFVSVNTRAIQTEVAIEGIGNFLGRIWEAIKRAINSMIDWVKRFFSNLFDASKTQKEDIKKLREALKKASKSGFTPEEKYKNLANIKQLKTNDKFEPIQSATFFYEFASEFFVRVGYNLKGSFKRTEDLLKSVNDFDVGGGNVFDIQHELPVKLVPGRIHGYISPSPELDILHTEGNLPGDVLMVAFLPNQIAGQSYSDSALNDTKIFMAADQSMTATITEVELLNKNLIEGYLDTLEKIVDKSIDARKIFLEVVKRKEQLKREVDALASRLERNGKEDKSVNNALVRRALTSINLADNMLITPSSQVGKLMVRVVDAGISYARTSIAAYT